MRRNVGITLKVSCFTKDLKKKDTSSVVVSLKVLSSAEKSREQNFCKMEGTGK